MKDGGEEIIELLPEHSIHAGQIFAEMLGAVNHPEFFNHNDVEVSRASSPPNHHGFTDSRPTSYLLHTLRFNFIIAFSHKSTSTNYITGANRHQSPRA